MTQKHTHLYQRLQRPGFTDGGVIFRSTILGEGVHHNLLAKYLLKTYNVRGIFSNLSDRQSDLEAGLKEHFDEHTINIAGCVALCSTRKRILGTLARGQKGLGESRHLQR